MRKTGGVELVKQDVQLVWRLEQVRQNAAAEQPTQVKLTETCPTGQLETQELPLRLRFLQDVHL